MVTSPTRIARFPEELELLKLRIKEKAQWQDVMSTNYDSEEGKAYIENHLIASRGHRFYKGSLNWMQKVCRDIEEKEALLEKFNNFL